MNRLVAVVMIATLAGLIAEIAARRTPTWAVWASLVFALDGVGLAEQVLTGGHDDGGFLHPHRTA